jgi:hypothetical protein
MAHQVSFSVSDTDRALITKIVDRALDIISRDRPLAKRDRADRRLNLRMDLEACHANGNPLDLAKMADADDFNVMHDVGGISRHIDRDTGKLLDFFSPRCSLRVSGAA